MGAVEKKILLADILNSSLTISEKRNLYCKKSEVDKRYIIDWKSKKNLVTEEIFKEILEINKMDENEFCFCISPINIPVGNEDPEWLLELDKILDFYNADTIKNIKQKDISLLLFPFIQYVADKLIKYKWNESLMKLSNDAVNDMLANYVKEVTIFIEKNIVIELEQYKIEHKFKSKDPKQQFSEFIEATFCEKEKYYQFLNKYAVSTRLITTRTIFFVKNIYDLADALKDSESEMLKILNIKLSEIAHLKLSVGDSHEKGKGVIVVEFKKDKVVYKPRNLDVCESYEKFIHWINLNSGLLDVKAPKGIYKSTYALIEFIEYKTCISVEEIKKYYERFGYTLAFGYILAMTDMHLENIVANSEYPIIIDGETMLQNSLKLSDANTVMDQFRNKFYMETILATAMLPNTAKIDKDLDLSALAGDEQKATKKYLMPVNIGTSDFHYEKIEYIMSASNNIPMLNNNKVKYKDYLYCVINGFEKMINFIFCNKQYLLSKESPIHCFAYKKIRFLTKSTQKYGELLGFLTHPSCCSKMYVRERTLQNIWAYPHYKKEIIKSEYSDMLFNDIPLFYTTTSSTSLYDSNGEEYKNFFQTTGYEKIIKRVELLDEKIINKQMDVMLMHLGLYSNFKNIEFNRKSYTFDLLNLNLCYEAEKLAKDLIDTAITDKNGIVSWPFIAISENTSAFSLTALDLYEGVSGISILFLELYYETKKDMYYKYYKKCIECCELDFDKLPNDYNAYGQKYSVLSPILLEIKLLGSSKYEHIIHKTINTMYEKTKNEITSSKGLSIDWISGISSMLTLLIDILYEVKSLSSLENEKLRSIIDKLYEIIVEKLNEGDYTENIGQAHGYSGIMLSLARYSKLINDSTNIKNIIKKFLRKELFILQIMRKEVNDKWCHGLSGMIISRIEILKYIDDDFEIKRDLIRLINQLIDCQESLFHGDSLCHGNSGTIISLKICIENGYDYQNKLSYVYNKMLSQVIGEKLYTGNYNVLNSITVNNPTLFTGLAGIGYMLLKTTKKIEHNILTLN
jgi:type 2 lantibiotic biosynthesis protein LanM